MGNDLKPAFSRSSFNQSEYPTSAPASTTMVLSVEEVHLIDFKIYWHSISIKTTEIDLLPVQPTVTFNAEKVVVHYYASHQYPQTT